MKTVKLLTAVVLCIIMAPAAQGQAILSGQAGDIMQLDLSIQEGSVQWQRSVDGHVWIDIDGETGSVLDLALTTFPVHIRAKVTGECTTNYSSYAVIHDANGDMGDPDQDGIVNMNDNCPALSNPDQLDADHDGIGDLCDANPTQMDLQPWSDPATWGGTLPAAGENVTIAADMNVLLDVSPPALGGLHIAGSLTFARKDLNLTAKYILLEGGDLTVGTEAQPFKNKAVITLTDTNQARDVMHSGTRGLAVMAGSILELHGQAPTVLWTKLNDHAPSGSTTLSLADPVAWKEGDLVVLGPSDFYSINRDTPISETALIASTTQTTLGLDRATTTFRWGLLQYATSKGVSLDAVDIVASAVADQGTYLTPKVLDERAPVANLSRNIVIQAPDDAAWQNDGFGAHMMVHRGGVARVEGVELRRVGQSGLLARYPFHWHMLSLEPGATSMLPDVENQYFRKNAIHNSAQRGVVIHGTNGVVVSDNVIYDVLGHAIFTEDASEHHNTFTGNLVLKVREPEEANRLKNHESRPSGFWISHPDNVVTGNQVADCKGFGIWLAYPEQPFGASSNLLDTDGQVIAPRHQLFGVFERNTTHSNAMDGIHMDNAEINDAGDFWPGRYWPTTIRRQTYSRDQQVRFEVRQVQTFKNGGNGFWDRSNNATTTGFISADNGDIFFAGAGDDGLIERSVAIGTSLNVDMNGATREVVEAAFATYHHTFDIAGNVAMHFPATVDEISGVFSTFDYYVRPVEKGQIRNANNTLIRSHPGYKMQPDRDYYAFAGAFWDPHGVWGPAGNYVVFDDPFYTTGNQLTHIMGGPELSGGVSADGPFYGFDSFELNQANPGHSAPYGIHVTRYDDEFNSVGTFSLESASSGKLWNMRHFAAHPTGIYELQWKDDPPPTHLEISVTNMLEESDKVVVAFEFSGSQQVNSVHTSRLNNDYPYTELGSRQQVIDSPGETYWQDHANNLVWVKVQGGRWESSQYETNWEAPYYEAVTLIVE